MDLLSFYSNIAVNFKFDLDHAEELNTIIYVDDVNSKLLALVGMRKLLSIQNDPPIEPFVNLVPVFLQFLLCNILKF